ncbi:MAG: choice-of-anchor D domain-containing protein, partial [Cyanobacteria bacterium J06627_8]
MLDRTDIKQAINGAFQGWQSTECFSPSGLGKTSLLRYIAHHPQLTAFFPDGVVYLLARRQPKSDLLYALFNAFYEADADYKPTDVHLRRLLQSKKALILLDDVDLDRDDVQGLLDAVPNCLFVFTSEAQQLWGDDGISLPLKGLPLDDAIALVERTLHRSLSPVEMKDARILCERLDGHPLQILQTLAVMKQKRWTIAHLLHQIPSAAAAELFTVQAAESLSEPQKRVLSALTVLGGVSVGITPLSALAAVPESDIDPVLQSLSDAHLIQVNAQNSDLRYRIAENLVDDFQQLWNLNDWVEATIEFFKTWVSQGAQGQQEILAEADTLIQVLEVAVQQGRWSDVLSLGNMMDAPLTLSHQWGRWERSLQYMLEAAQAIQNPTAEAWAMHQLGTQALCLENVSTAHHYLSQALTLREGLGDVIGANITRHNLNFLITLQSESEPDEPGSPESVDPEPISVPAASEIAGQESIRIGLWLSRIFLFLAPLVFGSAAIWYFFLRASALEFIPSAMEFPEIEVGTTVETEQIRIENTGERVLQVSDVSLVGRHVDDFALIEDTCSQRVTLQPTESCIVTIQFQPMNAGRRTARLSIAYEDGQKVQHLLVEGVGTAAEIKFNPNRISFADLETGEESRAESITIQNTGTADLRISSIELVGDNTNAFTLLDNGCSVVADSKSVRSGSIIAGIEEVSSQMSQDHAALAIAPGETCTLSIQFTPSSAGTHTAELVVDSNALGELESYVIQGTGLVIPRLDVDPTEAITFQSQEVGTTSGVQTITFTSNGTDAVTIDQLELQGNHRDDFVLSSSCIGQSIEPGESCTL